VIRAILLRLSNSAGVKKLLNTWPIARRVARRFIAGETLVDAVRVVRELNAQGFFATLDPLGENTTREQDARHSTDEILETIEAVQRERLRSGVSIKLSQIGLLLDEQLCFDNLKRLLAAANQSGIFIRIDMEDSGLVDRTLDIHRKARSEPGWQYLGLVIQAYLYRSQADLKRLAGGGTPIRLVKGAYQESEQVAYPRKADVDANFDRLTDILVETALQADGRPVDGTGRIPPLAAIASHDDERANYAILSAEKAGLRKDCLEFQMLYGIRRDLQMRLRDLGYPVRIYVPFGREWYPYFMRRLAERPANLWFFLSNLVRR